MADTRLGKVGITVKEPWAADISYEVLDITLFAVEDGGDGCSYTALKPNQGVRPGTDPTTWTKSSQAGQSIYDLAVKYKHFEGTEAEFEAEYQVALQAARTAAEGASAVETQVQAAEASRVAAETQRASAESERISAESERVSAEDLRIAAEQTRESEELIRQDQETERAENERSRTTSETTRENAETTRQSNELSRTQQFQALKTDMQTAIQNVDAKAAEIAEDIEDYEQNETARVSAENARATAETAREQQSASDHSRAESDHSTASSDHSQAANDHTIAEGDHATATSDHGIAETDHTTAASDHQRAESDHAASADATAAANTAAGHAEEAATTIDEKIAGKADQSEVSRLGKEVDEINTQEVDLSTYEFRYYSIKTDGTYGTNMSFRHKVIPVNEGEKYLIEAVSESGGRYAFFNSTANPVSGAALPLVPGTSVVEIPSGDDVFVTIPSGCIAIALYYGNDPYPYAPKLYLCYSIVALDTKIDEVKNDTDKNDTITRRELNWQPCGRWGVTLLTMNSGSFVTATGAYNVVYRPCIEGEMFLCKTTGSFKNPIGFCTSIPANGGTYTTIRTIKNTDGEVVVIAPGNGYIVARNDTTQDCDFMLYKLQDADTATLVPHAITDINETANRFLSVDSGSADYGTPVTAGSNNYFVSDFIDISGYVAVALPLRYGTSNLISLTRGLFGAMFYDSSKNIHSVVDVTLNRAQSLSKAFSIYTVPSGVKYVRFTGYGADEKCMIGYNRAAEASDNLEEIVNDVLRNNAAQTGEKTVFETNPDTEMLQKMVIANKKTDHGSSGSSTIPPLVLAHISDVHGQASQYSRFLEFSRHWKDKGYVNEIVDTGDVVTDTYSNGVSWRDALEGVEDVITVIGNHDTRASATERESADYPAGQNQWQYHSNIGLDADLRNDMYDRYFIGPDGVNPYVSNWGVTQPENAASNGYCYFYKDYTSRNLRLIGLDVMGFDNTEDAWLQARLAEARTLGYAVVILAHFCGEVMTGLPCHYTSLFETGSSRSQIDSYNADAHNIPVRVDSFQTDGGVFVGYIMGHYHRDMVNVLTDYPKQLAFAVSSGGVTPVRDFTKVPGSKSYDDFQVVSINTYDKTVRLIKVGADTDYYMRKKGTISVSYEIVTENGVSRVKGVIGEGW